MRTESVSNLLTRSARPFDVEILTVQDSSFNDVDRAYVANSGNDTMSIVKVVERELATPLPRNLFNDFSLTDLHISSLVGSETTKRLYLLSPDGQRVLSYSLTGFDVNGDEPDPTGDFSVGPSPARVVLQE